jgi:hypothetical protein
MFPPWWVSESAASVVEPSGEDRLTGDTRGRARDASGGAHQVKDSVPAHSGMFVASGVPSLTQARRFRWRTLQARVLARNASDAGHGKHVALAL